jgi:predicted AlkP superfamily phosphohydrolase/phosphomutase
MNFMENKVLFIGLDAAEPSLIEEWSAEGSLPNLKKIIEGGIYQRTSSKIKIISDPWINVFSGIGVGEHGFYNNLLWDPEKMRSERKTPAEVGAHPFWHRFEEDGPRAVVLDMPFAIQPENFNGVEVFGWAPHDALAPFYTSPTELKPEITSRFGEPPYFEEKYAPHTPSELVKVKKMLVRATASAAGLAKYLLESESWDLFMVIFGAPHRGGQKLWHQSCPGSEEDEETRIELTNALKEIYQECDRVVGEILARLEGETTILVYSPEGMGANTSRNDILPDMVSKIIAGESKSSVLNQRPKYLSSLRKMVPIEWRDAVKSRLPTRFQDCLTTFWRTGGIDWSQTPAFAIVAPDLAGLIRINLKGREAQGIVQPGEEFEFWVNRLSEGLFSFVDADSNRPIVAEVLERDQLNLTGARVEYLPDLFIIWDETPAANHREIRSEKYGAIAWLTPYKNPDGRSGNHKPEGFLLAAGPGFPNGFSLPEIRTEDIPVTILDLLGQKIPTYMTGRSLTR